MKKILLVTALLAVYVLSDAQINRATRLFEYSPAPGQFINNPIIGTPEAAQKILTTDGNLVSLGAFGGSIVLGFDKPVDNHPNNPYGIDFTIFGNAFSGSSEPGIIWVMKDENGNGLPDDTWYQIAGSSFFNPYTRQRHVVTWYRQADGSSIWKDSQGNTGIMQKNEFHAQPYYPDTQYFSHYPQDSVTLTGTLIGYKAQIVSGQIVLPALTFGYADNRPVNRGVDMSVPDNPYTPGISEGAGGDPVDISWAVDNNGNYVDLDKIHFVKIVTGALSDLGMLGEISTEISAVVATKPVSLAVSMYVTVIHPHPPAILVGDTLRLYTDFFRKGRRAETSLVFENSARDKADISPTGTITAIDGGTIRVSVTPSDFPDESAHTDLFIRRPDSIRLNGFEHRITIGTTVQVQPVLLDHIHREISGTDWTLTTQNPEIIEVISEDKTYSLRALSPGNALIQLYPTRFPGLSKTYFLEVIPYTENVRVLATSKTSDKNLYPAQWFPVASFSLNPFVENRRDDYSQQGFVSLAHVVTKMLQNTDVNFLWRDDAAGNNKLYLYSVEDDGLFTYGWGGRTDPPAFAKAWIVRHNGRQYFNGLNHIQVSNGDTIQLYYENNILNEWILTGFTAMPDSIFSGESVELFRWKITCQRDLSGSIIESTFIPYINQPVQAVGIFTGTLYTNAQGMAFTTPLINPPWIIESGNDAVLISGRLTTNIPFATSSEIKVFPNPVTNMVFIEGIRNSAKITITDMAGRIVAEELIGGPYVPISVSHLSNGVYLIVIKEDKQVHRYKLLKQ